jgi:hypothetical protein
MLKERFDAARTLEEFIAGAEVNRDLWRSMYARARVPEELVRRAALLPGRRHLLVLLEDWCGDAVNTIPALARLAESVPRLELRVLARDENLDLMDAHLTRGSRSIPVVMVLDEEFREVGWWGPRPAALQEWVLSPAAQALDSRERYREVRRWYVLDHARSTLEEVLALLETPVPSSGGTGKNAGRGAARAAADPAHANHERRGSLAAATGNVP